MELSLAEENYLKAIYHLSEAGQADVTTNAIAENLSTTPASVSDMIKRLHQKDLIEYERYKGVNISRQGRKVALSVIRKHRLWEVFLVEKLGFNWDEVHDVAEQLEHIKSPLLIERLDQFLKYPTMDPHGDPIPDKNGEIKLTPQMSMAEMELNTTGIVVKVSDANPSLLRHLDTIQIKLGSKIYVKERVEFDASLLITVDGGPEMFVSNGIAQSIMLAIK